MRSHRRKHPPILAVMVVELYREVKSQKIVAVELDLSNSTVSRMLKRLGVETIRLSRLPATCCEPGCRRPVEKSWHKQGDRGYWTGRRCRLHQRLRGAKASREYQARQKERALIDANSGNVQKSGQSTKLSTLPGQSVTNT